MACFSSLPNSKPFISTEKQVWQFCCKETWSKMGKGNKKVGLGRIYAPWVADGLQISSPLEFIKQGSVEGAGIDLGSRKNG